MLINANYHTHTTFCDGTDTAEDMVRAAIALGFEHLGFSGHLDYFAHVDVLRYFAEIRRLEEKYRADIEILCGIELDKQHEKTDYKNNQEQQSYIRIAVFVAPFCHCSLP